MSIVQTNNNLYNRDINPLGQLGLGAIAGLAQAFSPSRGQYYVKANYKGNGLADTSLGYMTNYDYKNPAGGVMALSQLFGNNGNGNSGGTWGDAWSNIGKKASGVWDTARNKASSIYDNMTGNSVPGLPRGYARIGANELGATSIPVRNGINSNVVDNTYQRNVLEQAILNDLANINYNDPYYTGNIGRYIGG